MSTPLDACHPADGHFAWCHLGQQSYLLKLGETLIACDPYLHPSPKRLVPPVMEPAQFDQVRLVLATHDHGDHVDRPSWPLLAQANPQLRFILPAAALPAVQEATGIRRDRLIGLDHGQSYTDGDITIHALAAAHETLNRDPVTGHFPALMYVIEAHGVRILHAGDTCLYDGMVRHLRRFLPLTAAMLPINGRDSERFNRGCIGNMTYQEAADLAGLLHPHLTLPGHFDMFAGNTEDPQRFQAYFQSKYPWLHSEIPVPGQPRLCAPPAPPPASIPQTKLENDSYDWFERHAQKLAEAASGNHDIVLLGDSITHFWEIRNGINVWKQLFADRSVMNLGFGWDRTCNVLWRLRHGEFAGQTPKFAIIHIGTNNLTQTPNYPGDTPEQLFQGISDVIDEILAQSPDTRIVLMCVFPRGLNHEFYRRPILEINGLLKARLSHRPEIELVDIGPEMMRDGELDTRLYLDNCHPNEEGYAIWARRLQNILDN